MKDQKINNIPIEFGSSGHPIIEIHFMSTTNCSPSLTPWNKRIKMYSNFSSKDFDRDTIIDFITVKLPDHPKTKKVVVSFHKP